MLRGSPRNTRNSSKRRLVTGETGIRWQQKTMPLPKLSTSCVFYLRPLWLYNLYSLFTCCRRQPMPGQWRSHLQPYVNLSFNRRCRSRWTLSPLIHCHHLHLLLVDRCHTSPVMVRHGARLSASTGLITATDWAHLVVVSSDLSRFSMTPPLPAWLWWLWANDSSDSPPHPAIQFLGGPHLSLSIVATNCQLYSSKGFFCCHYILKSGSNKY